MVWVLCAVVIVIIGAAVMASSGRFGAVPAVVDDRPAPDLPADRLTPDDLRAVRFDVVARGYSMAQVDALLARMAVEMQMPDELPADRAAARRGESEESPQSQAPGEDQPPPVSGTATNTE
ncbi:DivIVA domain-containing protein [Acidipropionibacterium jensenii]|uniref:DivIVA domain-containing protein n=1 Tax=Acidipropionibacterium jensenii TaxID=1749 RepID=UPI00110A9867|nr:DivIVA domain-containing protein [Acidipropionibacterium jensenii]